MIPDITRYDFCYRAQVNASLRAVAVHDTFLPADSFCLRYIRQNGNQEKHSLLSIDGPRFVEASLSLFFEQHGRCRRDGKTGTLRQQHRYAVTRSRLLLAGSMKPSVTAASEEASSIIRGRFTRLVPIIVSSRSNLSSSSTQRNSRTVSTKRRNCLLGCIGNCIHGSSSQPIVSGARLGHRRDGRSERPTV